MDKKQMLGFGLILVFLAWWLYMNQPTEAERLEIARKQDSLARIENQVISTDTQNGQFTPQNGISQPDSLNDTAENQRLAAQYGEFAPSAAGEEEIVTLENSVMKIQLSSKGGRIVDILLKDYKKIIEDENKEEIETPLHLLEDEKDRFEYLFTVNNRAISTQDLYFSPTVNGNEIRFRAATSTGGYIDQIYTLVPDSYQIEYQVSWENIPNANQQTVTLNWLTHLDKLEKNTTFERTYSTIHFKQNDERTSYTSYTSSDEEELTGNVKWVAHSNQFFNTSLIANQAFSSAHLQVTTLEEDNPDLKKLQSRLTLPNDPGINHFRMHMYTGPNDYKNLKEVGHELEDIIPFGWSIFGTINRRVIRPLFVLLDNLLGSKGMAILLLTFLVKMALYPITYRMLYSQAKTQALKPRMDKLKDKFKDDTKKIQMETMKLYQEYGVNPVGGCLPMLLQMPIWFALYRFFPASIEFRQAGFLWATDLSSYDAFFKLPFDIPMLGGHISLFTILYTISMIGYTYYNSKIMTQASTGNEEMMKMMKIMQYAMPFMFFFFFNNYASGLTAYLFFSNLMTIAQTVVTKQFVIDDDKIDRELEAYKQKPKKTSKFRERLNDAIKEQQRQQELRDKKK
ncbi:MAG TPA: membrane protein insertase YidC [Membranihabitans sp.]|nr:membrane protein insertase YidC [Membranihabitans sp.]